MRCIGYYIQIYIKKYKTEMATEMLSTVNITYAVKGGRYLNVICTLYGRYVDVIRTCMYILWTLYECYIKMWNLCSNLFSVNSHEIVYIHSKIFRQLFFSFFLHFLLVYLYKKKS